MSGCQAPGRPTALQVRQMRGDKSGVRNQAEVNGARMIWRSCTNPTDPQALSFSAILPSSPETGVGSAGHRGELPFSLPFSKFEGHRSLRGESGTGE